jgi:hypothetical protein
MNKILTVAINVSIWDKHASAGGLASLGVCLVGGMLYKQSPLRKENMASPRASDTPQGFMKGFADFAVNGEEADGLLVNPNGRAPVKANQVSC